MAKIVDVLCVPHDPTLPVLGRPGTVAPPELMRIPENFAVLRARLAEAEPDVIVVASGDHFNQWFFENMPTFCIGKAEHTDGPFQNEFEIFDVDPYAADVHGGLARELLTRGLDAAFDLSWSDAFQIDHGFTVPLNYLRPEQDLPIVPIFTNILIPPIATGKRFYELGRFVQSAVDNWSTELRVAVVASGHMTNSIGGPAMARFRDEPETEWDRIAWSHLTGGAISDFLPECTWEKLYAQGNGTPGFLVNVFGAGVAGGGLPSWSDLVTSVYGPACAFVEWNENAVMEGAQG